MMQYYEVHREMETVFAGQPSWKLCRLNLSNEET